MDNSWVELTGNLSLSGYLMFMGGLLTLMVVRAVRGGSRPGSEPASPSSFEASLGRFFFEYIGNLGSPGPPPAPALADRRRNPQARMLLDWIKGEMEERGFPATAEAEFLEHLREAIHHHHPATARIAARADED